MGNEGQQPPPQQPPIPQGYYGWQYDQEHPSVQSQPPPGALHSPVQQSPAFPPQQPPSPPHAAPQLPMQQSPAFPAQPPVGGEGPRQPRSSRYQEPIADMGTSLGLGQGMEYQFFDAPQPSQPIPVLRQARLQQLREERMRRQQRRMQPNVTGVISPKGVKRSPEAQFPAAPPQMSPSMGVGAPPAMFSGAAPAQMAPPSQFSPALQPPTQFSPVPPPMEVPPQHPPLQYSPANQQNRLRSMSSKLPTAAEPSQDTGMIQRVNIRRATATLMGAYIVCRVFGLLRTSLFAFVFGTGATSDAYLQAFVIPDLIFNIVAGGALSSAFIPVFTKYMVGERDEKTAWHIASAALNLAIAIMIVLALIAIIFAGQIVPLYNPKTPSISSPDYTAHIGLITMLARIMLLQAIVLGSGVIVNSVLNARQNFLLPAIGTVLYNVGLILGLIPGIYLAYHSQRNETIAVYAAAWGVVVGAILQVAIQIPGLVKVGMRYTPTFDWHHPGVIQIGRQMVPRIINAAMLYVSIFVDRYLISFLGVILSASLLNGLITQYYQALQLLLLPLGIFGMAVSTAAFPTLAENVAKGRFDRVRATILETLRSILFMSIPSSVGLIVLGLPIIQVLLEHGAYNFADAQATVFPLVGFSLGLAGLASVEILTRSFYAMRDSITPVIVSVGQFIFKIALSLLLINAAVWGPQWGTGALAFSTSIAGLLEAGVLLWLLHQRIGGLRLRSLSVFIGRILIASLAMGAGLFILRFILDLILVTTPTQVTIGGQGLGAIGTLFAIIKLMLELSAGFFIYIRVARRLGIEELGPIKRVLDRFRLSWI